MPRPPRSFILEDKSFFHVTWKCHNNDFLLAEESIKEKLYSLLLKYKQKYNIQIYAYCFMDNHPHILGFCETLEKFSRFFQCVNSQLAMVINRDRGRKGQVVMDRFRSCKIEDEKYLLTALRYIEQNPVRAGICNHPKKYRWSSFHHHARGKKDPLLDPLPFTVKTEDYLNLHELVEDLKKLQVPLFTKTYFLGSPSWMQDQKKAFREKWNQAYATGG